MNNTEEKNEEKTKKITEKRNSATIVKIINMKMMIAIFWTIMSGVMNAILKN